MRETDDDDDRTVIRASNSHRPAPALPEVSRDSDLTEQSGNALPVNTILGQFELKGVLGEGGFSIVYLAWDHSLGRHVALKEYIPSTLATRDAELGVTVRSTRHRDTFDAGLKSFVNEARLLASFDHPSLVKVYQFWEDRGTAFMVMPWYQGPTLKEALRSRGAPPDEAWLLRLLEPLTEALGVLHSHQCYHRDVAPDNIILLGDAEAPLLLDFGAARRVIGDLTQALTVILKPGYAPLEQYAEVPGMHQGTWTDVYALAAVVHYAIQGKTPPASVGRVVNDTHVPLVDAAAGRYSEGFLRAIDKALAVHPDQRTQTIEALRTDLRLGERRDPAHRQSTKDPVGPGRVGQRREATDERAAKDRTLVGQIGAGDSPRRRVPWAWVALASAVIIGTFAWWQTSRIDEKPKVVALPTPASIEQVDRAPEVAATTSATTSPPNSSASSPTNAASTELSVPAAFDLAREFDVVVASGSPDIIVQGTASKPVLRIGKDKLSFTVSSSSGGYVYVLVLGPDESLALLFPNKLAKSNQIKGNQPIVLPGANWQVETTEPVGIEKFLILVSEHPRDFGTLLKRTAGTFQEFETGQRAMELSKAAPSVQHIYAGHPICRSQPGCEDRYGAAVFAVTVAR